MWHNGGKHGCSFWASKMRIGVSKLRDIVFQKLGKCE